MGAGAAEHLKTLCCLGLPPESAMIAVVPLLHEIIPHGWTRICLFQPGSCTITGRYVEHPEGDAIARERLLKFLYDPTSLASLAIPSLRAVGIGWTLHRQGYGYLETAYYREMEAPLDSCWVLDAYVGDPGKASGGMQLTRPRSGRPFTTDDVRKLDRLRPWLAHALRPIANGSSFQVGVDASGTRGRPTLKGQMILTSDGQLLFQTSDMDQLCVIMKREHWDPDNPPKNTRDLPLQVQRLIRQIVDSANGKPSAPPRLRMTTPHGFLNLEAQWLAPASVPVSDIARDPKDCLIAVTIELHEHALARAARILREKGATPAQVKTGVQLAMGKSKQAIADELGVQLSSVASLAKKLYQALDVHNAAELGMKIWLDGQDAG